MHSALFLLTFPALAAATTPEMLGAWSFTEPTIDDLELLDDALSGSSFAASVGNTRVCYDSVVSLQTQTVAGTNYLFHIVGCGVTKSEGKCSESTLKTCELLEYNVQIFQQPWTSTLEVTSIEQSSKAKKHTKGLPAVDGDVKTKDKAFSENEKKNVDKWIQANGLNQYGDEATRMYTGGTPLFDESTGTTKDRYDYILSRHPERPWQVQAEEFAVKKATNEALGQGSVGGVFAMMGIFTVALAGMAILKRIKGRRDRYNPIRTREI